MTRILFTLLITCLFSGFVNAQETSEFSVLEPNEEAHSLEPVQENLSLEPVQEALSLEPVQEALSLEPVQETLTLDPGSPTLDLQQSDPLVEAPSSVEPSSLLTNELNSIAPAAKIPAVSVSGCNCYQTPFGNVGNVSYIAPARTTPTPIVARPVYPMYPSPNLNRTSVARVPNFNQVQRFNPVPTPFVSQVRINNPPTFCPTCVNNYSYAIPNRVPRRGGFILRRIAR